MGTLKRAGAALAVGVTLVGIAAVIGLLAGGTRFYQACAVVAVVCIGAALVMSGALLFGTNYPSRAAMVNDHLAPEPDRQDPVDPETRARLNSVYPLIAGLPSVAIALVHYVL